MKVLIKLGGTLLDDAAKRASMARQLAGIAKKVELVVVHGGGKQVTQFLAERGIESRFINGLRVSDEAVIDAVSKVSPCPGPSCRRSYGAALAVPK